ncbi:replication factor A2 [Nematocida parisii]|uniref:OB domain-containing protein n=1 Tax=Nematocida parisii (strain ERTm3) TaxID=935791 RepID=I3EHM9_NEMP3|nr:uncharacterized protein NEPG_00507 [Nematocida parisii ERTm1]EIJ88726.1 hypothetical protein NEQG_01416 [Nematocida parisii ERTm3]KAI5144950.1 replication factor A2 [Nematocida parisii]EIJ94982.1 hypothetical protein NEPG_00507 [Nematocida parisii ERTm1]KAI5154652.1 replication factor A2 [Nematocida parisii]KAI5158396.1 replication factor A2 [Nematocida parisii]|eukprot:XP_013058338.1 hypothetical protein NEPG_00507 [Nematocida parisii ERTm1]
MSSLPISEARGSQFIRRMSIKHVNQVEFDEESKQNTQFRGQGVSLVELMGWITFENDSVHGGKKFTLSDGTGSISCLLWDEKDSSHIKKGAYIRIVGSLSKHEQNISINCTITTPITDGNSVMYHLLMRIIDAPRASQKDLLAPSIISENAPAASQREEVHLGNFKKIHLDILSFFSNNQGETGLPINIVVSSLTSSKVYSSAEIDSGLQYLIRAGKLFYSTEDKKTLALLD